MKRQKTKNITSLKADLATAEKNFNQLARQQLMVQGVILYLRNEITNLEKDGDKQ